MNFYKKILFSLFLLILCSPQPLYADNHDTEEKTNNQAAISEDANSEDEEEDVPLNDPFAGNQGTTEGDSNSLSAIEEEKKEMSLYNFKLVGVISGSLDSYISLVNASGEVVTLRLYEELTDGVRLVDIGFNKAIFQNADGKYLIIDFKNKIVEKDDYVQK